MLLLLLLPCGDTFCLPCKGRGLAARAYAATPWPSPTTHTRDWLPRQRMGTTLALCPDSPTPSSLCRRPYWNVTGVMARACPDSRTHALARRASLSPQLCVG